MVRISEKVNLVRVKSQSGCFVNEITGERADTGSLSDAGPICQNILQLRIEASLLFK